MPPRVLLACDFHAKYSTQLARGLADHGADVILLTRDHDQEFGGESGHPDPGALERYARSVLDGRARHAVLPGRVSDPRAVPGLLARRRERRAFAPDVVHLQEAVWTDPRLYVAAGPRRGRYALTIHDPSLHPGDEPEDPVRRAMRHRTIRGAGLVFVHSDALREELIANHQPRGAVVVVPHGTALPEAEPVPADPVVLSFGRLSHYKGIDVLLDAMPAVWDALPAARLVIAGAGELPEHRLLGDERVELRHEHVREPDVPGLFARARVVALPYRQASQSGIGSRAKTYARGLVVTDVGGLPELVADGSGVVVPPEDAAALARALVETLGPGVAEELGARAASGAEASSWPRVAEATLAAYRRVLDA